MDAIFKALADPTRRALLDRLRRKGGLTLQELEAGTDMTRFGVMKHLRILEDASLVVSRKQGRFKHHHLNAVPLLEVVDRWIEPFTQGPTARAMLDLKAKLEGRMDHRDRADFVSETYIKADAARVWNALMSEKETQKYHFLRASLQTSGAKGGRYDLFRADGSPMLEGEITALDEGRSFETTFLPRWMPDAQASRVRYEIEQVGELTRLTVLHFDIPAGQDGVKDGWVRYLASLKSYIETGEALSFPPPEARAA